MPDCIYIWRCSLQYRGYLIIPTTTHENLLYGIAVIDPFGQQVGDLNTHQLVASTEQVWKIGRDFVDRDLLELSHDAPCLVELINEECICV